MCGIVGCAGNLLQSDYKVFRDMLLFDTVRGQDSTGICAVPCNKQYYPVIYKDVGLPDRLWDDFSDNKLDFDNRGVIKGHKRVLIGHNRAATQGSVTIDNAHPFNYNDIYGVHNGTLWNDDSLDGTAKDIDSKRLIQTIDNRGIEKTWPDVMGAAAVCWWDDKEETVNFIRNDERPLFWLRDDKNNLFWASEAWMLSVAFSRNGKKPKQSEKGNNYVPTEFKVDQHYAFEMPYSVAPTFKSSKQLKNYKEAHPKKRQTGFQSTMSGGNGSHFKAAPKPTNTYSPKPETRSDSTNINKKWAYGLNKAGKEMSGAELQLAYTSKVWDRNSGEWIYYVVAHYMDNGVPFRTTIYCNTIGSFKKWDTLYEEKSDSEVIHLKMCARPRITEGNNGTKEYAISDKHVKVVKKAKGKAKVDDEPQGGDNVIDISHLQEIEDELGVSKLYPSHSGRRVSKARFQYDLQKAGQSCANCDVILSESDAGSLTWYSPECVVCDECAGSPYVQNLLPITKSLNKGFMH